MESSFAIELLNPADGGSAPASSRSVVACGCLLMEELPVEGVLALRAPIAYINDWIS